MEQVAKRRLLDSGSDKMLSLRPECGRDVAPRLARNGAVGAPRVRHVEQRSFPVAKASGLPAAPHFLAVVSPWPQPASELRLLKQN